MKSLNLVAATLSLTSIAAATVASCSNAWAQDSMNKPMVQTNPMTGKPVMIVPPGASMMDKYRASWIYRNLDLVEVKKYRQEGFSDYTIRSAANIAMNTGLELPYVLRQVREIGVPLYAVAQEYNLSTRTVDQDIPGYGLETISIAPPMGGAMMGSPMAAPMAPPMAPASGSMSAPAPADTTTAPAPSTPAPTPAAPTAPGNGVAAAPAAQGSIVDLAMGNPDLSTLVAAVKAANLVDTLSGPGPFTLFAPTNEAFAKLPAGTVDGLLKPENQDKLKALLTYHVVPGKIMAADVMAMSNPSMPKTVNGATLSVKTTAPVMINGANVTQTDIVASNGVIHIIDTVLMPPAP